MGCDIHIMLEQRLQVDPEKYGTDRIWVCANTFNPPAKYALEDNRITDHAYYRIEQRNYGFFSELAGVRSQSMDFPKKPKGLPENLSPPVANFVESWNQDGHSFSWDYADEFCAAVFKHVLTGDEQRMVAVETMSDQEAERTPGWARIMNLFIHRVQPDSYPSDYRFVYFFDN
jgi:hypothetical protein